MKKILVIFLFVVLVLSQQTTVFGGEKCSDSLINSNINHTISGSPDTRETTIHNLLTKPFYGEISSQNSKMVEGSTITVNDIKRLENLNETSFEKQMTTLVRKQVDYLLSKDNIEFTQFGRSVVANYYPQKLDVVKSKKIAFQNNSNSSSPSISLVASAYAYTKDCYYTWRNFLGVAFIKITLNISWSYNPNNGGIVTPIVNSKSHWEQNGYAEFKAWEGSPSITFKDNYSAYVKQKSRYLYAGGGIVYPLITVTVQSNGTWSATGNTLY